MHLLRPRYDPREWLLPTRPLRLSFRDGRSANEGERGNTLILTRLAMPNIEWSVRIKCPKPIGQCGCSQLWRSGFRVRGGRILFTVIQNSKSSFTSRRREAPRVHRHQALFITNTTVHKHLYRESTLQNERRNVWWQALSVA